MTEEFYEYFEPRITNNEDNKFLDKVPQRARALAGTVSTS